MYEPLKRQDRIAHYNECPSCRGSLVNTDKGETVCQRCGTVLLEQAIDLSPDWKGVGYDERIKRMHVGMGRTNNLHDFGLLTEISRDGKDSHGRSLDYTTRQTVDRLVMWNKRVRTSSPGERTLAIGLARISEAADILSLPRSIVEEASHIFRKSSKQSISKSKSIAGMASASLYLSCRRIGISRTLKEIAKAIGINDRAAAKYYRLLLNGVESNYVPPPTVQKYISKLVNKEKIDTRVERIALELSDKANESVISSGKTPAGLAAAYIYIAAVLSSEHIPQRDIAKSAEVTEVTVRNRCREILQNFVIRQRLKVSNG